MDNLEESVIFYCNNSGRSTTVRCSSDETYVELCDMFLDFLKGCGYYVDAKNLADYYTERAL